MDNGLDDALRHIGGAQQILVVTGAGVSVPSGIPDFRSPEGLWARIDPHIMTRSALYGSDAQYAEFWRAGWKIYEGIANAAPNEIHTALSEIEKQGNMIGLVTQNIDSLHTQSGCTNVIELHGHCRSCHCMTCGQSVSMLEVHGRYCDGQLAPSCQGCGERIRPDLVLFGDPISQGDWDRALNWVSQCDLCLILGSRLEVYPASELPRLCHKRGVTVVLISESIPPALAWVPVQTRARLEDIAQLFPQTSAGQ